MIVMTMITIVMRRNSVCWDRGNLTLAGKIKNTYQKSIQNSMAFPTISNCLTQAGKISIN